MEVNINTPLNDFRAVQKYASTYKPTRDHGFKIAPRNKSSYKKTQEKTMKKPKTFSRYHYDYDDTYSIKKNFQRAMFSKKTSVP